MYPIALDLNNIRIALIGNGPLAVKRLQALYKANENAHISVFSSNASSELKKAARVFIPHLPSNKEILEHNIIMVVDIENTNTIESIAKAARQNHRLINVEDNKPFCDFHFSSLIQRGDLLLSVNTNGKSPALAGAIRTYLENLFSPSWEHHVNTIAEKRDQWQQSGLSLKQIKEKTLEFINKKGWLKEHHANIPQ